MSSVPKAHPQLAAKAHPPFGSKRPKSTKIGPRMAKAKKLMIYRGSQANLSPWALYFTNTKWPSFKLWSFHN